MSNELKLVQFLEKIAKLQKSLYQLALTKTDLLKAGDAEALGQMLKNELSHIKAIEALNNNVEAVKSSLAVDLGLKAPITLSEIINAESISYKKELQALQQELLYISGELKNRNELNQELLQQSLQFVNLNLDLLIGQQDAGNYSRLQGDDSEVNTTSIFNSKA
ncbi:flagellar protein FlgN [Bacillus sp. SG-1]|uniref:flagellar protein FlgN n=1 Tax=Bacillus sp. SG-1 TaxID=161544 RepID=UPI0001544BFD|nr:flagellar protein FlgN [Bacillus sp. SG-1]EDL63918.1 flagellar hook-associated protein K [Bacillus sp. SG-1]